MKKLSILLYIITAVIFLDGCGSKQDSAISEEDNTRSGNAAETSLEEAALAAYSSLLSGDRTLIDEEQKEMWWIPDFPDETMQYEYAHLDLDNDGIAELVIQMKDDPCGYNGVFHYEDGALYCWQSDGMEGSCRDYPLTMEQWCGNMIMPEAVLTRFFDTGLTEKKRIFPICSHVKKCFMKRTMILRHAHIMRLMEMKQDRRNSKNNWRNG